MHCIRNRVIYLDMTIESKIYDGIGIKGVTLFVTTPYDIVAKYGCDYEFVEYGNESFELVYSKCGLRFFCSLYDSQCIDYLCVYRVIEIAICKECLMITNKGINTFSSVLNDVIEFYGYTNDMSLRGKDNDKVSLNYSGINFIVEKNAHRALWKVDENLLGKIEAIVVCVSDGTKLELMKRLWVDRWVSLIPYLNRYGWSTLSDGSVIYEINEFYYMWEVSRLFFDSRDIGEIYNNVFISYEQPTSEEHHEKIYLESQKALKAAIRDFLDSEIAQSKIDINHFRENQKYSIHEPRFLY